MQNPLASILLIACCVAKGLRVSDDTAKKGVHRPSVFTFEVGQTRELYVAAALSVADVNRCRRRQTGRSVVRPIWGAWCRLLRV